MSKTHATPQTERPGEQEPADVTPPLRPTSLSPASPDTPATPPEQLMYAKVLATGMYTGLCILLTTFALYITGAVKSAIPIDHLPELWTMDVTEYLEAANTRYLHHAHPLTGWAWVSLLEHGDYLNFVGIAVLALVTIACFLRIIPTLYRNHDYVYTAIAVLEVVILALAASGILAAGH